MTDEMHDERVMKALAGRNPVDGEAVEAELSAEDRSALKSRAKTLGSTVEPPRTPWWRPAWKPVALAAVLVVAAFVAITLIDGEGSGPGTEPVYAAEAIRIAEGNPRLLVGADGWTVDNAGEFEADSGNTDFVTGDQSDGLGKIFRIDWQPAKNYYETEIPKEGLGVWTEPGINIASCSLPVEPGEKKGDYEPGGTITTEQGVVTKLKSVDCEVDYRVVEVPFLDGEALVSENRQVIPGETTSYDFNLSLPPENGVSVYISAFGLDQDEFYDVLDSVYHADVNEWLGALPADVVQTGDRPEIVEAMFEGLPLHPDVDVEAIKNEAGALDRYQLGVKVSGAVACAWLDQWAEAVKTGDEAAKDEATKAMSDSREWPILKEMAKEGGWAQVIWEYSRDMQNNDREALLGTAGTETIDGKTYELSPSYATGLGCDSEKRILRDE